VDYKLKFSSYWWKMKRKYDFSGNPIVGTSTV
jgi:hypothetical protein